MVVYGRGCSTGAISLFLKQRECLCNFSMGEFDSLHAFCDLPNNLAEFRINANSDVT